jgi:sulfur carrier protein
MDLIPVIVNGELKQVPAGGSIASLLNHLRIEADRVAVELNKAIVRKRDWNATEVPTGSNIEVVEFVGGG